jgi:AcrR family transcriptional regulator
MVTMNNDKRVQKTLKEINQSFLEIAQVKKTDKITIKEICDKANICRSTFYEHYEDYPSFLKQLQNSLVEKYIATTKEYHFDTDTSATLNKLVDFILDNKDMLFLLFQDEDRQNINKIIEYTKSKTLPVWMKESSLDYSQTEFVFTYFINGTLAAIKFWYQNQDSMDGDTFKKMLENTVKYGVYNYIYTV